MQVNDRGYPRTAVVFSGMMSSIYLYEWANSFADLPVNFIGIKDPENRWYQSEAPELLGEIRCAISDVGTEFLLCLGGSGGAFAALLFGNALAADRIVAICPQSACGQAKRDLGDHRWAEICLDTPSLDIAGEYPAAEVHYAANDELDAMHAKRLSAGVVREWPEGRHDLCQHLKATGDLRMILEAAIALPV